MNRSPIEWTDFTVNPLKFRDAEGRVVWGCVHASPGCQHCYAETLAKRYGRGGPFNVPTMAGLTPFIDETVLRKMLTYKPASGKRCFAFDMTDLFGEWVSDALLDRIFAVFALRKDVTWQILTKRADRMRDYLSRLPNKGCNYFVSIAGYGSTAVPWGHMDLQPWPLRNVHAGISAEDQPRLDDRLPQLLQTPAAVRFLSCEPLLRGLNIAKHRPGALGLGWCIVGGESGPGARPCETGWVRSIVRQCQEADVPVFVKQMGANVIARNDSLSTDGPDPDSQTDWPEPECGWDDGPHGNLTRIDDGYQGAPVRVHLKDRKGGDPSEWPADLRVRQFPEARS